MRRGKLLSTKWLPTSNGAICYTCLHHGLDGDSTIKVLASTVRVRTYEHLVVKCYFCSEHVQGAMDAERVQP